MKGSGLDWSVIRHKAAEMPEEAFEFVREGLRHTVDSIYGDSERSADSLDDVQTDDRRHVNGQQLAIGLRDFAIRRYGLLAGTVLGRWGIRRTDDFGTIVFALIDRGELRASENDSLDDFKGVYDFAEAFGSASIV